MSQEYSLAPRCLRNSALCRVDSLNYSDHMLCRSTYPAILSMLSLALMLGCQRPNPDPVPIKPIAVRLQVAEGTEGAISYYIEGMRETAWFGPAYYFDLAEVGPTFTSSGGYAIFFQVTEEQESDFSDLTELIIGNHMALEVDGIIYGAPVINARLPGACIISGEKPDGLSREEYNRIMSFLTIAKPEPE
jgi:hypothetical protein